MCLTTVDKNAKLPKKVIAWKVFQRYYRGLISPLKHKIIGSHYEPTPYKSNMLYVETSPGHLYSDYSNQAYPIGFHAFASRRGAREFKKNWFGNPKEFTIKKVELTDIVAVGPNYVEVYDSTKQFLASPRKTALCYVAKNMKILKDKV